MRTTVTLDPDTVAIVEAERARTGASFKEAIKACCAGAPLAPVRRASFRSVPVSLRSTSPTLLNS